MRISTLGVGRRRVRGAGRNSSRRFLERFAFQHRAFFRRRSALFGRIHDASYLRRVNKHFRPRTSSPPCEPFARSARCLQWRCTSVEFSRGSIASPSSPVSPPYSRALRQPGTCPLDMMPVGIIFNVSMNDRHAATACGRGPTSDISPRKTFSNWGSRRWRSGPARREPVHGACRVRVASGCFWHPKHAHRAELGIEWVAVESGRLCQKTPGPGESSLIGSRRGDRAQRSIIPRLRRDGQRV